MYKMKPREIKFFPFDLVPRTIPFSSNVPNSEIDVLFNAAIPTLRNNESTPKCDSLSNVQKNFLLSRSH